MNDTITTPMDVAGDAGSSLQSSSGDHGTAKASDPRVDRSPDEIRLPPFGRRGPFRSWLPGMWGDAF